MFKTSVVDGAREIAVLKKWHMDVTHTEVQSSQSSTKSDLQHAKHVPVFALQLFLQLVRRGFRREDDGLFEFDDNSLEFCAGSAHTKYNETLAKIPWRIKRTRSEPKIP